MTSNMNLESLINSSQFQSFTKENIIKFDGQKYQWREFFMELFSSKNPENLDLNHLHETQTGKDHVAKELGGTFKNPFNALFLSMHAGNKPLQKKFKELYHRFVQNVIAPHLGGLPVVYQRKPTLRVMFPSKEAVGVPHIDANYLHSAAEINFWFPICDEVRDENSLYAESEPNKGDYRPFNLNYGDAMRFYGNQCHHYTVANTTTMTRVSLDIRVIPCHNFDPAIVDSFSLFHLGEYFCLAEEEKQFQQQSKAIGFQKSNDDDDDYDEQLSDGLFFFNEDDDQY